MSLNYILLWFVAVSCIFNIINAASVSFEQHKKGIYTCIGILAAEALLFCTLYDYAGSISFGLWLVFLVIPSRAKMKANASKSSAGAKAHRFPIPTIKALIALNVVMYLLCESRGGSTNARVLIYFGALIPELAYEFGQWWRLLTSTFLHFGFVHLFMNCFALYLLGPFVEQVLGKFRFLFVYIFSGVASMGLITALTFYGHHESNLVIGASGSVMGVIGASAGIYFLAWVRHRSWHSTQQLKSIGFILVIQAAFDLSTPQVSFVAHFGGVVAGFLACVAVLSLPAKRTSESSFS